LIAGDAGTGEDHEAEARDDQVEAALEHEVDALEDRRLQLEQRHGLAGHQLVAVGHDLHRRGRDPHGHAHRVAAVDQLDRLLLGEVRVGDHDLLHAVLLDQDGQLVERAEVAQPVVGLRRERDVADGLVAAGAVVREVWATASIWSPEPTRIGMPPAPEGRSISP
jgi:hypothetical protein